MFYYMPTHIYEEAGCVRNHGKEWTSLGSKAMIVTGHTSAKRNGALADVEETLEANQVSYILFDQVEENPSIETIMQARQIGLDEGVDFVIGIGGGSPMDAAKAIALMIRKPEAGPEYLYTKGDDTAIPVVEVPTTCGTGSESTPYAILTIHAKETKGSISHRIFPAYGLIDAGYLAYAPKQVICNTAVDALGHLIESYINSNATDYSRMLNEKALEVWSRSIPYLTGAREALPTDYSNLMNASCMAGMSISHTGTSLPHGLSYPVTYTMGMPHGAAIGYFLYGYLKYAPAKARDFVLNRAGFKDLDAFGMFYEQVCHPGNVDPAILERSVDVVINNPAKLKNCPYQVTETMLRDICGLR